LIARARRGSIPLALAALAFGLAIAQRTGLAATDTKIDLHTDPIRFLGEITSLWAPSSGLGGVETAQYAGYLFPMGPFFALGHLLGVSDWLVDRLWLGLLLSLGSWGVVRLCDRLIGRPRATAHAVAGLVYVLNPYVVVFANRTTVTLIAYAALPWLLLLAYRGAREPRGWRLPAAFALVVTACGGGVNAAVVAFVLLGPLLLLLYEPFVRIRAWRDSWDFAWRAGVLTLLASLWWIAPILAQVRYGIDFLRFTEPAGAIWTTTSLSESFRLMGYWIAYIGVGFGGVARPYFSDAHYYLFSAPIVIASLAVPGLIVAGFAWTRRHAYAAFFLLLVLLAAFMMTIGFPEGTRLRSGATFAYNHVSSVRIMRTTYKAGPLLALGLAGLAGLAAQHLVTRLRERRRLLALAAAVATLLLVGSIWPLVRGQAIDEQLTWKHIPAAWTAAARDLDRTLPADQRAAVLPGDLYAFYNWGGTVDPILPDLAKSSVAQRNAVPYGDLHGIDLLWTTDALVQQDRALPGQLQPLLRLLGAGAVVTGTDDDYGRSGAADPAVAARVLAEQGLRAPNASFGARKRHPAPIGDLGPTPMLPEVRRYGVDGARRAVRIEPASPDAVVDGSAQGVADLVGLGETPRSFRYAADLSAADVRAAATRGTEVVVTDSNRRGVFVVSRMRQNRGTALGVDDPISEDAAVLNPFPERGTAGQTVSVLRGARYIRSPFSPGYPQFAEHRPFAAFDGDPRTYWLADAALEPRRQWVEIGFVKPLDITAIDVLPRSDAGAIPVSVTVAGHKFAVHRGWNRLRVDLHRAKSLHLLLGSRSNGSASSGGLAEVRVPGLHVEQSRRPPTLAETALRGSNLDRTPFTYVFERQTGDQPFRRGSTLGSSPAHPVHNPDFLEADRLRDPGDGEAQIDRVIDPPVARDWRADAWVTVSPEARDSELDRLAGYDGAVRVDSSGRFQGQPRFRGSAAFDGDDSRPWLGRVVPGQRPWLSWALPRPESVTSLRLVGAPQRVRRPTRVELSWPGGSSGAVAVGPGGEIALPRPAHAQSFRLTVLASAFPAGTSARERLRAAVGIGEIVGAGVPPVRGLAARIVAPCGAVIATSSGSASMAERLSGTTLEARASMRVYAGRAAFEAGVPLRATSCGASLSLAAQPTRIRSAGAIFRPYVLRLRSAPPTPVARAAAEPGRVLDQGKFERGGRSDVRVALTGPATLVLGESYSSGWRASCDGRSLGKPRVVDGYAMGWSAAPPCNRVEFAFAPNKPVHVIQILSALFCLLLFTLALRRRRVATGGLAPCCADAEALPESPDPGVPLRRALAIGLGAAAVLGFCFSLRAGVAIFVGISVIAWLGIGPRLLALAAGGLLALVVPALYVLFPAEDLGGYNPGYAGEHIAGHWAAVAAYVLLLAALVLVLSRARHAGRR
jgi:hypothetical protein